MGEPCTVSKGNRPICHPDKVEISNEIRNQWVLDQGARTVSIVLGIDSEATQKSLDELHADAPYAAASTEFVPAGKALASMYIGDKISAKVDKYTEPKCGRKLGTKGALFLHFFPASLNLLGDIISESEMQGRALGLVAHAGNQTDWPFSHAVFMKLNGFSPSEIAAWRSKSRDPQNFDRGLRFVESSKRNHPRAYAAARAETRAATRNWEDGIAAGVRGWNAHGSAAFERAKELGKQHRTKLAPYAREAGAAGFEDALEGRLDAKRFVSDCWYRSGVLEARALRQNAPETIEARRASLRREVELEQSTRNGAAGVPIGG
ncbi:MAG: hypothetical protein R3A78_03790 [Polyangiales bacterium]